MKIHALLLSLPLLGAFLSVHSKMMYVGSWSGIHIFDKQNDGSLKKITKAQVGSSGFLAISSDGRNLYSTGQDETYASYSINPDGTLIKFNAKDGCIKGNSCAVTHVSVDSRKKFLFGANYNEGSFVAYSLSRSGSINARTDAIIPGVGDNGDSYKNRQAGPHAHMITPTPGGKFLVGVDLGADSIWIWSFNYTTGKFGEARSQKVPLGSGCRHLGFHPSGKFAYVLNEITSTISVFSFDQNSGTFQNLQLVSSLPQSMQGNRDASAGEIRIHPSGNFLYVTNRNAGSDNVGAYSIGSDGKISPIQFYESGGGSPRGMNMCPKGKFLYVANEIPKDGKSLRAFKVNLKDGTLAYLTDYDIGEGAADIEFSPL